MRNEENDTEKQALKKSICNRDAEKTPNYIAVIGENGYRRIERDM